MPTHTASWPALRGAAYALASAVLFGISTPWVQRLGIGLGPFTTAGLLYAGAACAGALLRQPVLREARLQTTDTPRLITVAMLGAVIGPVALAWGLQRTSGTSASLMLTLEAVFTAVLAWRLYGETIDRRVGVAVALLLAGGLILVMDQQHQDHHGLWGLVAVMAATAAWGADNALSRALAERDPGQVVLAKALLGASATAAIAWLTNEPTPTVAAMAGLWAIGASGYGLSLRFYLLAQRTFGAARTGSVFAFAPFMGAAMAMALGERTASAALFIGGALMLAGVIVHLMESHDHMHTHEALTHEHPHTHDDGHHNHTHHPMPQGTHSHRHTHEPLQHQHAHVPDVHHTHRHEG